MKKHIFLIAEIGQAHEGSLGIAHSYIDALASTGVDAIKFQTHIAEAESSVYEPFRVKFSYEDNTRMDYWKRMEFTEGQWAGLKKHCEEKGMEFLSSPFSNAAVKLLNNIGVAKFKIGSGEVNNFLLLQHIAVTGKEIILSSGMSSYDELDKTVNFLKPYKNTLSVLQCTTSYPTQPEQWGLNVIKELKERYGLKTGFSDHSGDIFACLSAVNHGAEILEFHAVFDKRMFGPDTKSSLTIDEISYLVKGIRQIERAQNVLINKDDNSIYTSLKEIFEKSLSTNKDLPLGHKLTLEDLEARKPKNQGIAATQYREIIGKKLTRSLKQWDFITEQDIQ